jgi:predicted PurR-regulated permease PerM
MPQSLTRVIWTAAATAVGLFLAWHAAETLLLIFAGVLLGVLLDALTRALRRTIPIGHGAALAIVCTGLGLVFTGVVAWSGYALLAQWDQLSDIMTRQIDALRHQLDNFGESIGMPRNAGAGGERSLAQLLLPDPSRFLAGTRSAFSAAVGAVGSGLVVVMIGIFAAANPALYRAGFLKLVPAERRPQIAAVLDETGHVLRWWLVGQMVTMTIIGISIAIILALLGVPGAALLGIQAGLVNFIPYLGPLLAAVPIALTAASQGPEILLWVLAVYFVVQVIEGYVLTPLIQDRAVALPPVVTLSALMLLGAWFGAVGIALATPLAAVLRVALLRLYVDDADERARVAAGASAHVRR